MPGMSRLNRMFCTTAPYRLFVRRVLLPWALQGLTPKARHWRSEPAAVPWQPSCCRDSRDCESSPPITTQMVEAARRALAGLDTSAGVAASGEQPDHRTSE